MVARLFTKDIELDICQKYLNGFSSNKISREYSCHPLTIRNILNRYGIKLKNSSDPVYRQIDISKTTEEQICNNYFNNKTSILKIAKEHKISLELTRKILIKNNIPIHTSNKTRIAVSKKQELEIVNKYFSKISIQNLAREYSCSPSAIDGVLKRNNIEKRSQSETNRIYTLDESYFDVIDSEDKAYFFGLLMTDGCNIVKKSHIKLELQKGDESIVTEFQKRIKTNRPIRDIKPRNLKEKGGKIRKNIKGYDLISSPVVVLDINSIHLSQQLYEKGMINNKSLILKFPDIKSLPEKWIPVFLRGCFDGDGCISYGENFRNINCLIIGTHEFLNSIKNYLLKQGIKNINIIKPERFKNNTEILSIRNLLDIYKLKNIIYNNHSPELCLKRKYNKFLEVYNYVTNNLEKFQKLELNKESVKKAYEKKNIIYEQYKSGLSINKISILYNIPRPTVKNIILKSF